MELLSFTLPTFGAPGTILGSFLDDFVMDLGAARDFFSPGWGRELGSPNKSGPWMGWDGTHRWGGITVTGYPGFLGAFGGSSKVFIFDGCRQFCSFLGRFGG